MASSDKGLALLLAAGKPKGSPMAGGSDEEEGEGGDDLLIGVAEDLIKAVKAGDASGVASALRAAHDQCAGGYDEEKE
jgi:hypothetical protein